MHFDGIFSELGYAMPQVALQALLTVNKPNVMWNAGCCKPTVPACPRLGPCHRDVVLEGRAVPPIGSPGSQFVVHLRGEGPLTSD